MILTFDYFLKYVLLHFPSYSYLSHTFNRSSLTSNHSAHIHITYNHEECEVITNFTYKFRHCNSK